MIQKMSDQDIDSSKQFDMGKSIIKKGGLYTKVYNKNSNRSAWRKSVGPIGAYLQDSIEIDDKLTLLDLFNLLESFEEEIDIIFMGSLNGKRTRPFYEEISKKANKKINNISHIEIGWVSDFYRGDKEDEPNELFFEIQVLGVSKKDNIEAYYPMSHANLNDWKHLRVQLSDHVFVNDLISDSEDEVKDAHINTLLDGRLNITLYDLLNGFLAEISMFGSPDERREWLSHNDEDPVENNDDLESPLLTDLIKEKQDQFEKSLETEDYESASKLKIEIEEMKKELDNI